MKVIASGRGRRLGSAVRCHRRRDRFVSRPLPRTSSASGTVLAVAGRALARDFPDTMYGGMIDTKPLSIRWRQRFLDNRLLNDVQWDSNI